jgi:hypothetical protein
MVRANFDFIYFIHALASDSVENAPIPINVRVYPIRGSPIRGVLNVSPIAPDPFDFGRITFHFFKLG